MGLRSSVLRGIDAAGFEHPTDIQAKLIPAVLTGRDVIGQAKTGTGKTAAFGLPILHLADKDTPMQSLILTPTRELAAQVASELEELGQFTPIRTSCIIGGESMQQQSRSVKRGGHILVGTPGRVMDMQGRREINFDNVRFVVLDEVDRMLDIGFREDIRKILKSITHPHQTVFVSATISEEIDRLGRSYMRQDVERITTMAGSLTVSQVDQKYISVMPWDKKQLLLYLLRHESLDTTLVFCRTKATVDRLAVYLREKGINVRELHGDMAQQKRNRVMQSMRKGNLDVLVASDLAARGLDIEHISHVINYDLPEDSEVYVHRIGRTARVGRRGCAWSFVTPEQGRLVTEIEKLTGAMIEKLEYNDFTPGPIPDDKKEMFKPREVKSHDQIMQDYAQRAERAVEQGLSDSDRKQMFPDGVEPKSKPKRTLGSRMRTRRRR